MLWVAILYFFCLSTRIKLGLVSPTKYIDHLSFWKKKKQTSYVFGNKNCSQNILSFIFVFALRRIEINCVYFRNILTDFVKIALCQLTSRFVLGIPVILTSYSNRWPHQSHRRTTARGERRVDPRRTAGLFSNAIFVLIQQKMPLLACVVIFFGNEYESCVPIIPNISS